LLGLSKTVLQSPSRAEISEAIPALEIGADTENISLTTYPPPVLSETFSFAAEMIIGDINNLYIKK
jgi:dihydrolipoamide dehydrogenase